MIKSILLNLAMLSWIAGMILILLSNASGIISQTKYARTGWKKYRMGYFITEIRELIEMIDDEVLKTKLRKKIIFRRIAWWLLIATPILILIGNL